MGKFIRRTRRRNKSKKGTRMKGGTFSGWNRAAPVKYDTTYKLDERYIIKNITDGAKGFHKWPDSIIEFNDYNYYGNINYYGKQTNKHGKAGKWDLEELLVEYITPRFRELLEKTKIDKTHTHIKDNKTQSTGRIESLCYCIKTQCDGEPATGECDRAVIHFFIEVDQKLDKTTSIKKKNFGSLSSLNSGLNLVHLGYTNRNCYSTNFSGWDCKGVDISNFFNNEDPEVPDFIDPTFVGVTITEGEGTTEGEGEDTTQTEGEGEDTTEESGGARRRKTKQTGKKKRKSRAKRRRTRR